MQDLWKKYFNSSMVRLKVAIVEIKVGVDQFQFLYGAIKSYDTLQGLRKIILFQFLYGAIKRILRIQKV